ncbi:putative major facilitator superfamily, MFS transporter superfamily [Septoria linicola]|nr:putative major facilitator superfamily, MFS transporter superfamily [Septoria linicola]
MAGEKEYSPPGRDTNGIEDVHKSEHTSEHDSPRSDNDLEATQQDVSEDKETRRVMRRVDLRLLPILAALYSFALIDRTNLANARVAGADEDLGLSVGERYSLVTMMFFVPYILFELPSNIVLRKIGPGIWLPALATLFGVVSMACGFTYEWTQLLGCRVVLGALEAGFYPGCVYLLSCWYVRYEIQKRFSIFYMLATLASGLANILGYGLSQMDGVGGLHGWRWIFIIEGLVTVALGLLSVLIIVPFPDLATKKTFFSRKPFLSEREASLVTARLEKDRGDAANDEMTMRNIFTYICDWKVLEWAWLYLIAATVSYSFSLFLPIILEDDLGYSTSRAQILSFPPYAVAAPWMLITAWIGDKYRKRGHLIIFNNAVALIGLVMIGFATGSPNARYAGTFLGVAAGNTNVPTILTYMHNNIVGQTKRSVASAVLVGASGLSGIIVANIFRQQDSPGYRPALITVIIMNASSILLVAKNFWLYNRMNKKADRGEIVIEGQPGFRLTL